MMGRNSHKKVGYGQTISMRKERWVLGMSDGMTHTPSPTGIYDMNVAALLTKNGDSWNVAKITTLFSEEERKNILVIPLSKRRIDDGICWNADPWGIYTTKSEYRASRGEI
ncbi:unnamed protein product [Cuscuta europaea]|uniref:Uncharacterized protein n=1 Tax=Cuscuta europaea TaxID=41803 RepID=A0A9P1E703_CUSEU|nr:unnamed protein product [Cuscuta europaea]